jgi:hypothetical protein
MADGPTVGVRMPWRAHTVATAWGRSATEAGSFELMAPDLVRAATNRVFCVSIIFQTGSF